GSRLDKLTKKEKDAFREKTYQLKLTSAAELEKFLTKLEPVKVDYVDVTRLHHSDFEKIKLELKVKALQIAKVKAETLLKSIGAEIGKPIMVREIDYEPYQPQMRAANMMVRGDMPGEESQIGFRKIRLQAQVTAQFEIK
ncbi:MAG TPA: SIMPL domain-containing protein, partial [Cyclobacteriaceae bacterium]|nr:SIMPL domain-containing protein [Cyclobacteriaceae bacterium]